MNGLIRAKEGVTIALHRFTPIQDFFHRLNPGESL
jgi:hypothetical protein